MQVVGQRFGFQRLCVKRCQFDFAEQTGQVVTLGAGQRMYGGVEREPLVGREGSSFQRIAVQELATLLPFSDKECKHPVPQVAVRSAKPCGVQSYPPEERKGVITKNGRVLLR